MKFGSPLRAAILAEGVAELDGEFERTLGARTARAEAGLNSGRGTIPFLLTAGASIHWPIYARNNDNRPAPAAGLDFAGPSGYDGAAVWLQAQSRVRGG